MRTAWMALALGGCVTAGGGPVGPIDERPVVRDAMLATLSVAALPTEGARPYFHQTHGPFVVVCATDAATASRVHAFLATLLADYGRWWMGGDAGRAPHPSAIRVFVFDTRARMRPHLSAMLGEDMPAEDAVERYMGHYRGRHPHTVTCSLEWGLGWLGDLCLRALHDPYYAPPAGRDGDAGPPPNRWFLPALQSMLYNCFRTPDGRFHGLNVASYYRPQAQALLELGTLIALPQFLRDDYDPAILVDDALRVQGRELLAWLHARGALREFLLDVRRPGFDPSWVQNLERATGLTPEAADTAWRAWLVAGDAEIGDSAMAKPFPVLGVLVAREADELPGVGLFQVCPDGPAARAGLQHGDRVLAIDGTAVATKADLLAALQAGPYGRTAPVTLRRGDRELTINIPMDRFIDG